MLAALLVGSLFLPPKFTFYADGPYDPAIPKPESVLGYEIGQKTTNFRDQERTLQAISAAAGKRVRVIQFGKSYEGRPLRIYITGSSENMRRLDEIQKDNQERAEGKNVGRSDPVIVWVNESIHGDETASFESGMQLLYNLTASRGPRIKSMLDHAIVVINPSYNPDGHERYAVYYNSIATGTPEPGAFEASQPGVISGRLNHYRFDMNRDRIAMSQAETRQEVAEFLKWHPQVYIDQHGQVSSYFFPPNAMSQNVNVDRERVNKWTNIFGRATGKAFDEHGWTYFVKDTFDLYYPGYLDSWTTLSGAIGMTHETDGGRLLATRRQDDSLLTLRDGVIKHFTSAHAVIGAAAEHHDELLASFVDYRRKAVSGVSAGAFQSVAVTAPDARPLLRLAHQLTLAGIDSTLADRASVNDGHDYWSAAAGSAQITSPVLVIKIAQGQGHLARTLLEPTSDFEPEFMKAQLAKKKAAPEGENYPGPDGTEFYDLTGWSLPYAHNLRAWWSKDGFSYSKIDYPSPSDPAPSTVGYAIPYTDDEDALATIEATQKGIRGMISAKAITTKHGDLLRGTFMFLAARNDDGYEAKLFEIAKKHGSKLVPLESSYPESDRQGPGSESVITLRRPNIAIVFGSGTNMAQVGAIWYLMEQVWHLPFTALSTNALSRGLDKYTTLIVPAGAGVSVSQVRDFVSNGGCVIALGGAGWALGSSGFVDLGTTGGEHQDLPGSLFRAELDPRSFLSYGYPLSGDKPITVAVPVEGNTFYKARKEGGSAVKFSADEKVHKLLSGWEWPDDTEKGLAGAVWLQDMPVGRGHAIIFAQDPTSRAMWPGLYKMLLNAILIGPSA